ncbi:sensor domain-containing diguanylate cyclase [Asanoa hainanensis]|uniref:sensor domain-containing diguanylate cyclase n=1 Tax=Asanoa hainanensis TaxID=560556 RepID=UPI0015C66323|nr:sensor domain-containing diguanylate cyclase [Asanoa hainanensis]
MATSIFRWRRKGSTARAQEHVLPRFKAAFQHAGVGIAVVDQDGLLVEANPAFAATVALAPEQAAGRALADLFQPVHRDHDLGGIVAQLGVRGPAPPDSYQVETKVRDVAGDGRWTMLVLSRIIDGSPFVLAVGVDITEQHRLRDRLRQQARHDPLTSLANRAFLQEWMADVARQDGDVRVGICFADLDGFKQVNDHYGHRVGDQLLTAVATRLKAVVNSSGQLLGRIGGDEFVALVAGPSDVDAVGALAKQMIRALVPPFTIDGMRLSITASVGVALSDRQQHELDRLLHKADQGLYQAKRGARGTWSPAPGQ